MEDTWKELRRDFPALEHGAYLNAAAASPTPRVVRQAVTRFYQQLEQHGDRLWEQWLEEVEGVRRTVARLVGAEADEIAFVPNTSTGMNLVVDLLAADGAVLSDELEFPAVTLPWIHRGVAVHFVPAIEGVLRLESFQAPYAPKAATIAISHVQFSNGCRQDLDALGALKAERLLVVCGSQSVGAFGVHVARSGIDALAVGGHKWMCAGYGTGFVYISRNLLAARSPRTAGWRSVEDPFAFDNRGLRLLASNRRTELGCPPFGPIFALGAAAEYLLGIGIEKIQERVLHLNEYLTFRLERAGWTVLSPGGEHRSGQALVAAERPDELVAFLAEKGVAVTRKPEGIRVATHFYNTEADVDALIAALRDYGPAAAPPEEPAGARAGDAGPERGEPADPD
jgi:selenocysteine lyase/cysteine desulfurase